MQKPRSQGLWTLNQRMALLGLCVAILAFLTVESFRQPVVLTDPLPLASPRGDDIQDRLDPNTADAAALSAIPNLGEKRAQEIVDFRDAFVRDHPQSRAFNIPEDLMRLKGFGEATVANLAPYLSFSKTEQSGPRP